jgi:diaminopimelate dehydrogenase
MKIRIGISGYGNLGRGVEKVIPQNPDMELAAVFTQRDIKINTPGVPVYNLKEAENMTDKIDVMILCGGAVKDLPEQGPRFAALFNTVDSYDNHAKIPEYLELMNKAAANKTAVISTGWDPGLFSMMKMLTGAALPVGETYTFWGYGLSQGHSEAVRGVDGVKKGADGKGLAVQYTVPSEKAMSAVKNGENPTLSVRDKHLRECYVVPEDGANLDKIESDIKNMPNYFEPYETIVNFISEEELAANHSKMPHGGFVFRSGNTGGNKQIIEFALKLENNPEFTASVLLAYARAAARMSKEGNFGAKTVLDVPLAYLSPKDSGTLVKELL